MQSFELPEISVAKQRSEIDIIEHIVFAEGLNERNVDEKFACEKTNIMHD